MPITFSHEENGQRIYWAASLEIARAFRRTFAAFRGAFICPAAICGSSDKGYLIHVKA